MRNFSSQHWLSQLMVIIRLFNGTLRAHFDPMFCRRIRGLFLLVLMLASAEARAGLVIIPTFDSTITSDPNAAVIENTINWAIQVYQARFSDPITVKITFKEMSSGLGMSQWQYYSINYSQFRSKLGTDASTTNDNIALTQLTSTTVNPVDGSSKINVKTANLRALGITGLNPTMPGGVDGIVSLNTSIMNLTRPGGNPGKYDLMAVAEHEIDEVLGLASALDFGSGVLPEDLFRYDASGNRNFTTNGDTAYFSLDGTKLLARFNQNSGGDFGDWWTAGSHSPQVQDAFATSGATPNLNSELVALDAIGYSLLPPPTPAIQNVAVTAGAVHLTWSALAGLSYQVQYTTNPVSTNWNNLGSPIVATNITASASDSVGASARRFYRILSLP